MQMENAIEVNDITKSFKIYSDKGKTLKDRLSVLGRNKYQKRDVLRGISFNVKKGEAVGLIGKNGCGKSTTLKMLTRIMFPDSGTIKIRGKVSSLLELGAGFHPDMSGRENIYLNASIFGLTKKEIETKIDKIIEFSELEDYIENPVRTYSSGMYMRLSFSVAINVDAEILLIDEILGVGDVSFQKKCFEKLQEIKQQGTTIVIVSHSLEQIEQICDRSIWIQEGKIEEEGNPRIVNAHYFQAMEEKRKERYESSLEKKQKKTDVKKDEKKEDKNTEHSIAIAEEKNKKTVETVQSDNSDYDEHLVRIGNKKAVIDKIKITDLSNNEKGAYDTDDTIIVKCTLSSGISELPVRFAVSVWRDDDVYCYGTDIYTEKDQLITINGRKEVELKLENVRLFSGKYWINAGIYSKDSDVYDEIRYGKQIRIFSKYENKEFGLFQMKHEWIF